jgi:hypothetical protein
MQLLSEGTVTFLKGCETISREDDNFFEGACNYDLVGTVSEDFLKLKNFLVMDRSLTFKTFFLNAQLLKMKSLTFMNNRKNPP